MPSRHYHDAYEILYILSGELYYFIENKTYKVIGGDLLFMNVNDLHKMTNAKGKTFERIALHFKKDFLKEFFSDYKDFDIYSSFNSDCKVFMLRGNEQSFVDNLFGKMLREFNKKSLGYEYYLKILLLEFLIFLKRKVDIGQSYNYGETNHNHKKVFEVVGFINANYSKRLTLDYISENFYISPSYFSKIFKDTTGFTFIEYLNSIRTKEARILLKESKLKVTEIADNVGFESSTHFGRVFKKITGLSPLKYRRMEKTEK